MKLIEIRENGSKRVATVNEEPSKTDPSWTDDVDVNNIIKKYLKTGQINHLAKVKGTFADVSQIKDLHQSMIQVTKAQQLFDSLPSDLRLRFGNSPVEMVNFFNDPNNTDEAIKMGFLKKPELTSDPNTLTKKTSKKPTANILNDDDSNDDE